jgi:membrane glycosyltransferase
MTGVGSYLTAPLWLLFLVLGILISLQAQFVRPEYFPKGFSLFPKWPAQDPVLAAWVFGATMGLLILPKILAFLLLLTQRRNRREFGGGLRTLIGIAVETFLSALIAPVMMVFQSTAVGEILLGHDAGWQVQRRDDGGVSRRELYRKFAVPTLFGVVMGASAYAISLPLTLWMSPVILGLLLAIPIGAITSSASRFKPFLSTPEETNPPRILLRAHELSAATSLSLSDPLSELRANHELRTNHLASIATQPPRVRGQVDPQLAVARAKMEDARTFDEAVSFLNTSETMAMLNDRSILEQLLDMETSQPDLIRRSV